MLRGSDLRKNSLRGTLPAGAFAALTSLTQLYMDANQLSGTLDGSLALLTALRFIHLGDNYFSGTLPNLNSQLQLLYVSLKERQLRMAKGIACRKIGLNDISGTIGNVTDRITDM